MVQPRRKLPPLNALRAFEVSGRRLNFRAAAEELGVSQGAVAQQVRALEDQLGLMLFQRLARGLALTPQGAAYLADVTRAFDTLSDATGRLLARPDAVTISVTPTVAAKLLIPRLAELKAALPDVELRTVATEALSDFDRDQVDIAVRLTRQPFPASLEARLLFRQELVAVASPHLVKGLALPLTADALRKLPLLHDTLSPWPLVLRSREKLPGAVFNHTTLALDAALAGQGVALACRAFVAADLEAGRLVRVTDATTTIEPDYFLIRKRSSSPRKAVDAVWHWCAARLSVG
ncbi:DNA-binding transcriptional LysR family regulator [Rhizobium leguminosarum]|uniref:DNA-binding transcriptional LysR family regulator n=1 Tax=Rhizobium leguminosarum TaxID=384 RepID=A0AAE2MFI9_RHILE|nr:MULTISPECIES: LysR substrate-binding domain-containing protein [Rhizobium]MBB4288225.1 DNA-binding transcriptional LysR family regulator [Rhizobium leguminosarum]MBB4295684.1 DNA-binding transcriptional LysR family regulator [Rhizobium leguminosarum]MBB4307076.1 DNA-binding transcriptional LysR family regulator [Rhizobium leguminosarum]MBB4417341.1 DNA-binding transcriptional LysR family regulator [Rhizobium leguminosarum]MBB4432185.1 DNA-binding transcriptional LysR family regulator [Rhizo